MMDNVNDVSIIMPVFNARKYIDKTIQSIINQTYKHYQLLMIDDGSDDGTGEICKSYALKYNNFIYIRQANKGTCAARNRGIQMAKGKYITFSDHDDMFHPSYLEQMVKRIEEENADVVKCGVVFEETYLNGKTIQKKEKFSSKAMSQAEVVRRYSKLPVSFFGVWNTLYRSQLLKQNNILFPEDMRHGEEDYFFNTAVIKYARKFSFCEQCLYIHYRRLMQSTSAKFYHDRIAAMSRNYKLEVDVLKPFYDTEEWKIRNAVLFSRKVAGIISYCRNTLDKNYEDTCIKLVEEFVASCGYEPDLPKHKSSFFLKEPKYYIMHLLICDKKYKNIIKIDKIING